MSRRTFLRAATLATAAAGVGTASSPVRAQSDGTDLSDWFDDVDNYDGVEDHRGASTVTVTVGSAGNGGPFGFGPAAVRVDPGTTVVWEWTGEGGLHNVVATDGAYGSDLLSEAGATFEHTFEEEGISTYVCVPHEPMGMKGAVVVGDAAVGSESATTFDYGGWFDDVDNFSGTVDRTGQDEVTVQVGAAANGGPFGFEPAAVHVDSGTTVVWEWTGEGGSHNVVDEADAYESDLLSAAGATYALTFDGDGISKYACAPHEAAGMKGAVVVGDPVVAPTTVSQETLMLGGSFLAAFLSPIAFALFLFRRGRDEGERPPTGGGEDPSVAVTPEPPTRPGRGPERAKGSDAPPHSTASRHDATDGPEPARTS